MSAKSRKPRRVAKKATARKAATNGRVEKAGKVIRLVALKNPATERESLVRVTADGRIAGARYAERFGVKKVASWREVPATSWAEATAAYRAGKGAERRLSQVHAPSR